MAWGDGSFGFSYCENPEMLKAEAEEAEFRAAHELGVCPECHWANGLHNEGACSRWRPSNEREDDDE